MNLGVSPETLPTNEDLLELGDDWAVTDKTNYHHVLVMSCLQQPLRAFFFFFSSCLEIEYPHSDAGAAFFAPG